MMAMLELMITDTLMQKLQEKAEIYAVEPSDIARSIIAYELSKKESSSWRETIVEMTSLISNAVVAASKMKTSREEE